MNPSSIPSASSPRHNPSINTEASQLLTLRGEDIRPTTIRVRSRSHTENAAGCDPRGHWDYKLSGASLVVSTLIHNLHIIEKYNENHTGILAAKIINFLLMASLVAKNTLRCCAWSLTASKWALQPEDPLEQDTTEDNVSCIRSIIQPIVDEPLYYLAQACCFMTTGVSLYLAFTEKDHENHDLMLSLEGSSVFFSFSLLMMKFIKIGSPTPLPNRQQQAQFSLNHLNYQTV